MIGAASPAPLSLEDAVHEYVITMDSPFTIEQALPHILDRMTAPPSDAWSAVDSALMENEWIFCDDDEAVYVPKSSFFKGSQFRIVPQPEEIEANILIPGHRFMPFVERDVFPATCQLRIDGDAPIPCRTVKRPIQDLLLYLTFYGQHGALQYLTADHESNMHILDAAPDGNTKFKITVFDMTEVYERYAVKPGDAFLCTVKDWALGIYSLEHIPHDPSTVELRMQKWIEDLEHAILDVWNEGIHLMDVYAQLSEALFVGPESLRQKPPLHFGGFLAKSTKVAMQETPMGLVLSHTDAPTDDIFERIHDMAVNDTMTGRRDSLAAILNDLGLTTTEAEIEAYMRDARSRGTDEYVMALTQVFAGRSDITFYDEAQADSFAQFLDDLWDHVCFTFDPKHDKRIEPLRSRILSLLNRHTAWLRDCDRQNIAVSELPREPCVELGTMTAIFSQVLGVLNIDEAPDTKEIRKLTESFDLMESRFNELFSLLVATTVKMPASKLRVLPDIDSDDLPPPECMFVYQLKVTLKGIRPPIWRRLHVLGETTLEQLHIIIQVAMGWENYHLHDFTINGIRYGQTDEDDFFDLEETEPEAETYLCEVADEGTKFKYTYDYGDDWEHTIQVEKLLPPDEDIPTPRCIKGKRACPPEDCGGPWGYQSLLEVINDPTHPDYSTLSEWIPPNFAPEQFSLPAINAKLQRI